MEIRRAKEEDFSIIKSLQEEQHFENVSDKATEGFVSVQTSIEILKEINSEHGIVVATVDSKVVGYEFPLSLEQARKMPSLVPFIERVLKLDYEGKKISEYKWIIEGQILVARKFKGKGIAETLHKKFIEMLKPKYELIVTEISDQNARSLHVHKEKLGLKVVYEYSANGRRWFVLLQDIR